MHDVTTAAPARPTYKLGALIPFALMHLLPLGALYTGADPVDWLVCLGLYYVRMVGITAGFHRYFSHRAYKLGRVSQFLLAFLGTAAAQKGPLWWAAHHRHHHKYSDAPEDLHSPRQSGFWWSHLGWILSTENDETQWDRIQDFAKYPELRWLNRHFLVPPTLLGVATFLVGGWSMLFVGFFLSTALLYHGTFVINSLAHVVGWRRFETTDTSRNSFILALITCGEGWHNNHHHYQSSANQGFFWWELDVSYYLIRLAEFVGLAWDVRTPPAHALTRNRISMMRADEVALQKARAAAIAAAEAAEDAVRSPRTV